MGTHPTYSGSSGLPRPRTRRPPPHALRGVGHGSGGIGQGGSSARGGLQARHGVLHGTPPRIMGGEIMLRDGRTSDPVTQFVHVICPIYFSAIVKSNQNAATISLFKAKVETPVVSCHEGIYISAGVPQVQTSFLSFIIDINHHDILPSVAVISPTISGAVLPSMPISYSPPS